MIGSSAELRRLLLPDPSPADFAQPTFGEVARELNERIGELARELLGEPNRSHSTRQQLRFVTHGSIAVEIAGAKQGQWYDHENSRSNLICVLPKYG